MLSSPFPVTRTNTCCLRERSKERYHGGDRPHDLSVAQLTPYPLRHGDPYIWLEWVFESFEMQTYRRQYHIQLDWSLQV
ncbi:hypothetical protein DPMN_032760 [Dreissena polymorpha]|uniref:Uncharacterized protein n=1 Tax=Dreissena polymorpha TaxID=45954 RepID=A0A9D4M786_DREPO|nr:hypothetical protein DPMN_032760 [Dreissena polymorpha]